MGIKNERIKILWISYLSSNIKNGYNEWYGSIIFSELTFIKRFASYIISKNSG